MLGEVNLILRLNLNVSHVLHSMKKSVQIISIRGEVMAKRKIRKKKKIRKGIRKKIPKIKLKKKKATIISEEKKN